MSHEKQNVALYQIASEKKKLNGQIIKDAHNKYMPQISVNINAKEYDNTIYVAQ